MSLEDSRYLPSRRTIATVLPRIVASRPDVDRRRAWGRGHSRRHGQDLSAAVVRGGHHVRAPRTSRSDAVGRVRLRIRP